MRHSIAFWKAIPEQNGFRICEIVIQLLHRNTRSRAGKEPTAPMAKLPGLEVCLGAVFATEDVGIIWSVFILR